MFGGVILSKTQNCDRRGRQEKVLGCFFFLPPKWLRLSFDKDSVHKVMLQLHQVCLFSHQVNLRGFPDKEGQEQAGIGGIVPRHWINPQGSSYPV